MQVHEAVEQAIAEEYVRLQGSTLQELLQAAGLQQQALNASVQTIAQQAYQAWQASGSQAAYHLYVTLRVSQGRSLESVLRQPDVQAVLRRPFEQATDITHQTISQAWVEGATQGHAAANQNLQIAGFDSVDPVPLDQAALNRLLDDASANGDAAYQRYRAAVQSMDPEAVRQAVQSVTQDQALRARAGADVAGRYAFSDAMALALCARAKYYVWVTSFSANTCRHCARLHGTRRRCDQPFPGAARFGGGATLPVWGGVLGHPPRHPNCRCRLIPWGPGFEEGGGPTLTSMVGYARLWWQEFKAAVRAGLRGQPEVTELARVRVSPYLRRSESGKIVPVVGHFRTYHGFETLSDDEKREHLKSEHGRAGTPLVVMDSEHLDAAHDWVHENGAGPKDYSKLPAHGWSPGYPSAVTDAGHSKVWWDRWRDRLSKQELTALGRWQTKDYQTVQSGLRYDDSFAKRSSTVRTIDKVMARTPAVEEPFVATRDVVGFIDEWRKLPVGATIRDKGYVATHVGETTYRTSPEFSVRIEVPRGARGVLMPIDYEGEAEFLLPRGTEFEVVGFDTDDVLRLRVKVPSG